MLVNYLTVSPKGYLVIFSDSVMNTGNHCSKNISQHPQFYDDWQYFRRTGIGYYCEQIIALPELVFWVLLIMGTANLCKFAEGLVCTSMLEL